MVTNNYCYGNILARENEYREYVLSSNLSEKMILDKRLENIIKESVSKNDLKKLKKLLTLRRPMFIGRMEAKKLSGLKNMTVDEQVEVTVTAQNDHANKYWGGVIS